MSENAAERVSRWGLRDLLIEYPGLRVVPTLGVDTKVAGEFLFSAQRRGQERIDDSYQVEISIPSTFPDAVPSVRETAGRVPPGFHTLQDGSLCLGSPTRLRLIARESGTIGKFVERCLLPYLYGRSYYERHGQLPFGELDHGHAGVRQDLASMLGVTPADVLGFVTLLGKRKRVANKRPCPCGSRCRLGRCHHRAVNRLRSLLGRAWFRGVGLSLKT